MHRADLADEEAESTTSLTFRILAPHPLEVGAVGTHSVSASSRGAATDADRCLVLAEQGDLAEDVAGAAYRNRCTLTERCRDADRKPAGRNQVQRIGRVVLVDRHLAAAERAPTCDREELDDILFGHTLEQTPLHSAIFCQAACLCKRVCVVEPTVLLVSRS